ncbi:MAG: hypothetical protein MJZ71_03050 [Bacteroidales bacterium]|nr:hypothetical protein [Bacteroidales bacterium]
MKKVLFRFMMCLMAVSALTFVSCNNDDEDEDNRNHGTQTETTSGTETGTTGEEENGGEEQGASLIGTWLLEKATQYYTNGIVSDYTPIYGENFHLRFEEDGTLVTFNDFYESPMQWVREGNNIGFIQAPGANPVMYSIEELTETRLVLENESAEGITTVMELIRVNE